MKADGKEFFLRSYVVFMAGALRETAASLQNARDKLDRLEEDYNNWVDTERRRFRSLHLPPFNMGGLVKGNLGRGRDLSYLDREWANVTIASRDISYYKALLKSQIKVPFLSPFLLGLSSRLAALGRRTPSLVCPLRGT